ncbi:MAG: MYXO-CTERM sorting domain-containing protein [Polyangiaceae bacterium]
MRLNFPIGKGLLCLAASLCVFQPGTTAAQAVRAALVLQQGQVPTGGDGTGVESLSPPTVTPQGKPVVVGSLSSNDAYVWIGDRVVFYSAQAGDAVSAAGSSSLLNGGNDADSWAFSATLGGHFAVYSDLGRVVAEGDRAPGFASNVQLWSIGNTTLDASGAAYFFAELSHDGSNSSASALFRAANRTAASTTPVLKAGDDLNGFSVAAFGVQDRFAVSRQGGHTIVHVKDASNTSSVVVGGVRLATQGEFNGREGNWRTFDTLAINSSGHSVFAGDTTAVPLRDYVIAYDGQIVLQEGETLTTGPELLNEAEVRGLAINDLGHVAHIWSHAPTSINRTLYFGCNPADLKTSTKIVTNGDELDFDGDGSADATLQRLWVNVGRHPAIALTDSDVIYAKAYLKYGSSTVEAVVGFPVGCSGGSGGAGGSGGTAGSGAGAGAGGTPGTGGMPGSGGTAGTPGSGGTPGGAGTPGGGGMGEASGGAGVGGSPSVAGSAGAGAAGVGGAVGLSGAGGVAATGGSAGILSAGGASSSTTAASASGEDGGCGCRHTSSTPARSAWLLLMLGFGVRSARRRRKGRAEGCRPAC